MKKNKYNYVGNKSEFYNRPDDFPQNPRLSLLDYYYQQMVKSPRRQVYIPHSSVFYAKACIERDLGIDVDIWDLERSMYLEGMLPIEEYGVPKWFAEKYFHDSEEHSAND